LERKIASEMIITLLIIGIFATAFNIEPVEAGPKTWTVDDDGPADFHTIHEAIIVADPGDTVLVHEGYYAEGQIDIYKNNITLIANGNPILDGLQQGHVLNITSSYVTIEGFTIKNSSPFDIYSGIYIEGCGNNITNNNIANNYCGIHLDNSSSNVISLSHIADNLEYGIRLDYSLNNTIRLNNIVANIWYGLHLYQSLNNTISHNNVTSQAWLGIDICRSPNNFINLNNITNNRFGMALDCSPNNILRNNTMANNEYNFGLSTDGLELPLAFNDVDVSNTVGGKPVICWNNKQDKTIPLNAGYVALINCTNIKVENLSLQNNLQGIMLLHTKNSRINLNNITGNFEDGIFATHSYNNTISLNNITDNEHGIFLGESYDNNVTLNNITDNHSNGLALGYSSNNTISKNSLANDWVGLNLWRCSHNIISVNNILENGLIGIYLGWASDNTIFHNSFADNQDQVYNYEAVNIWDNGYPSGGNYWSDYAGVDVKSGPDQDQPSSDGIGDASYVIDANNVDHYPLMNPWGALPPTSYVLTIHSSPTGVTFAVDGVSRTTSWSGTYSEGASVSLVIPEIYTVGDAKYYWNQWSDGNTSRSRTVTMNTNITLTAHYTGPYYELTVASSPITGITFIINGVPQITPYTEWLLEGSYTLEMPETHDEYVWSHWLEDGDTNRIKTFTLSGTTWTGIFEQAPPPPTCVGGEMYLIDKTKLTPSPWTPSLIAFVSMITLATAISVVYVKHRKKLQN